MDHDLLDALETLSLTDPDTAAQRLEAWLGSTEATAQHLRAARLATRLGRSTAAMRALQLALQHDPDDREAREELAELYEERGEHHRAEAVRADEPPPTHDPTPAAPDEAPLADADLLRLLDRFEGREGVHARMWHDPKRGTGYSPVRAPLTPALLKAHLDGTITLGVYVVRHDQTVGFVVFDVDAGRAALEAALGDPDQLATLRASVQQVTDRLHEVLRTLDLDPILVDSGYKGRHLWLLLDRPHAAQTALSFAQAVVSRVLPLPPGVHIDVFPRQAEVPADGLGNLVKLPLGLHLRSRRRAVLLDEAHQPLPDPVTRLTTARRTDLPELLPVAVPAQILAPADLPAPTMPAAWTEASWACSRWIAPVLRGCGVLRAVVERGLREGTLPAQAPVVLNHTLGHLPEGPAAVNHLYSRVPEVPAEARLKSVLRGQPMGCSKIRGRLASILADGVPCDCRFPERAGAHQHPLRHLDDLGPDDPPPGLDDLLERYAVQRRRVEAARQELQTLRLEVVQQLAQVPGRRWSVPGGAWALQEDEQGLAVLQFLGQG
jgi:hypothetical protein